MTALLEITGADIAALDDAELRDLVGLLCEADYRKASLSCSGITWGGHQDAADGGLDVVVRGEASPPASSFVPRSVSGFQVKKPNMPPGDIKKEMCPDGQLRESIKDLIQNRGAYVIVSSGDSTTDSSLRGRIDAMKEAVANEEDSENFHVDFFDRGRIASWVRMHSSLILKVRNDIGRPIAGWRGYGNWANAPGGVDEEYIFDDGLRLDDRRATSQAELNVEAGLVRLRRVLAEPRSSIRLAGLSGVGKTRLVQALFDYRIGTDALNPLLACYTDMSDGPVPDPPSLADQLIEDRTHAILIIDNCSPELHNRLARRCTQGDSTISLLTVEYDVRDDLPEETQVFRLEPASEEIIEKLISLRYSHMTAVDARTIADFSGGNARLAIALADTVEAGETLSGFRDEELFERLFRQRNEPDGRLLVSGEVCSLVYSFEGTDTQSEESELGFLASIVERSPNELYRDVTTLKERGLAQSRQKWRAILPHAIANRLAKRALESIPRDVIVQAFLSSSERLVRSFSRRLSYLHDCEPAIEIANDWLRPDGWLGSNVVNLNSLGFDVLKNIAPVSPPETLDAIERAVSECGDGTFLSDSNLHACKFVSLLRHLAYDSELFTRSAGLMSHFALARIVANNRNIAADGLRSLFHAHLSGTHATVEQRAAFIENLLESKEIEKQGLGFQLLDAALESWHFSSSHEFGFGARPRDFGYQPETRDEIEHWYSTFIEICTRQAVSDKPIAARARKVLAENVRGLWIKTDLWDVLENAAQQIHSKKPWSEGWIAVRGIIRLDSKNLSPDSHERLEILEAYLKPNQLAERARAYALSDHSASFDLGEDFDDDEEDPVDGWKRAQDTTFQIGTEVAQDGDTLKALLPELVSTHTERLHIFAEGLAVGSTTKKELWDQLCTAFESAPEDERSISALCGFITGCGKEDPALQEEILDDLVGDDFFGQWFPYFQMSAMSSSHAIERLHLSLDLAIAHVSTFGRLAYGRLHEGINDLKLSRLVEKILEREQGVSVATEILMMRFHRRSAEDLQRSSELMAVSRTALLSVTFPRAGRHASSSGHDLGRIAEVCLQGAEGEDSARRLCEEIAASIASGSLAVYDCRKLLFSLASVQPGIFLDSFLGASQADQNRLRWVFFSDFDRDGNPLDLIADERITAWCNIDPEARYTRLAWAIDPFTTPKDGSALFWKPIVEKLVQQAPNLSAVLESLADSIRPRGWSGSLADLLEKRLVLFEGLFDHENAEVRAWARSQHRSISEWAVGEREREEQRDRALFESFE